MRKRLLMTGMVAITTCVAAALSGCAEKKEGPQTIIIELADPDDTVEEPVSAAEETETEAMSTEITEAESESAEETKESVAGYPQIEGLSDDVTLSYTHIGSSDPIIGMVIADILPDIHAKDLDVISVQAYMDGEEVVPYGELTFSLEVEPDAQVVLYKLDDDENITSEQMEITDGTVSYQTSNCGRWLVINTNLETETEAETTESATAEGN